MFLMLVSVNYTDPASRSTGKTNWSGRSSGSKRSLPGARRSHPRRTFLKIPCGALLRVRHVRPLRSPPHLARAEKRSARFASGQGTISSLAIYSRRVPRAPTRSVARRVAMMALSSSAKIVRSADTRLRTAHIPSMCSRELWLPRLLCSTLSPILLAATELSSSTLSSSVFPLA